MPGRTSCSAVTVTRDPDTGAHNGGIFRGQIHSPTQVGLHMGAYASTRYIFAKHQERGLPLQVAMVVGHHPAFLLAGDNQATWDRWRVRGRRWAHAEPARAGAG